MNYYHPIYDDGEYFRLHCLEGELQRCIDEISEIEQYKKDNDIVYSSEMDEKLRVLYLYKKDWEKSIESQKEKMKNMEQQG